MAEIPLIHCRQNRITAGIMAKNNFGTNLIVFGTNQIPKYWGYG